MSGPGIPVGARGELGGTGVEVLGWAAWRTSDGYPYHEVILRTDEAEWWWLEIDAGHIMLCHPVRDGFEVDPRAVRAADRVTLDRERTAFPLGSAQLTHVEGEYWKDLEEGEVTDYRPFYHGATCVAASRERGDSAWEWSEGVYLDHRVVERAFGVTLPGPAADEAHPARPYPFAPWARAVYWGLLAGVVTAVVGLVYLMAGPAGEVLFEDTLILDKTQGDKHLGMFDSAAEQSVGIALKASGLDNTWGYTEIALTPAPPEGATPDTFEAEALVLAKAELGRYSGYDSDGSWVEDDTRADEGFRIGSGSYMVFVGWELDPLQRRAVRLDVKIVSGYIDATPLVILALVLLAAFIAMAVARAGYRRRALTDAGLIEEED
ncbi:MAG: hypothetical protein CSA66_03730 [Proteobacteria bacterium]|nr:MAG: hypothetical protein CSA66_03730 [Pseudomonadota bacterium]